MTQSNDGTIAHCVLGSGRFLSSVRLRRLMRVLVRVETGVSDDEFQRYPLALCENEVDGRMHLVFRHGGSIVCIELTRDGASMVDGKPEIVDISEIQDLAPYHLIRRAYSEVLRAFTGFDLCDVAKMLDEKGIPKGPLSALLFGAKLKKEVPV